jgi:hypothetical protein
MGKVIKILAVSAIALAFTIPSIAQSGKLYGKKFKTEHAYPATELSRRMGDKEKMENVVVEGEISEVCQAEGCWMKLKNNAGENVFIKFKDHAFLIPKDLAGHNAYVSGTASRKTVSVEDQKHYAEDAGKTDEEIAKITQPKVELRVDATGVIIE